MTYRPPASTRRQNEFAQQMASDFDSPPLHNKVHDRLGDDEQLATLCDAAALADQAQNTRRDDLDEDAAFLDDIEEAWETLDYTARQCALEVVAECCQTVLADADAWVSSGYWSSEEIDEACSEARDWLQTHTNEAKRVGALDVLEAVAGGQS